MNVISFDGRLTKDAELKQLQNNTVCNFDVACNTGYGDRKKTIYFRCDLWNKRAESLHSYLTKGIQVFVSGELSTEEYTNKNGDIKTNLKCRINDLTFGAESRNNEKIQSSEQNNEKIQQDPTIDDDEIPF